MLELYSEAEDTSLLLSFVRPPIIGEIEATKINGRKWKLEATGAKSWNEGEGIRLVNCQWDFDYQDGHFNSQKGAVLMREKDGDKWAAILSIEHEFEGAGKFVVACKIQDSAGGECVETKTITVD